ncbi:MAG TPA: S46 family peptidase [Casimicrobiaceae bacterium]
MVRSISAALVGAALWIAAAPAGAEEGLWAFDRPPSAALQAKYGFAPRPAWLDALRLSAVRVGGASGSFVSADGLVLTNHHVALSCVQDLSTEESDLVRNGFVARTRADERVCPGAEVRRLESFEEVTERVRSAIKSKAHAAVNAERNIAIAALENECKAATGLRCEVVTFYRGAAYQLYRYRVWTDVRLVFAPETRVAFFGGDPDNFVYPRFDLDFALMRVYDGGTPVRPAHYLTWTGHGVSEGDLVFAAGHPYSTDRLVTIAQLKFDRDARYPLMIASAKREQRVLQQFGARSAEATRRAADELLSTENWLKAMLGEHKALHEPALMGKRSDEEALLRKSFRGAASEVDPWIRIDAATRNEARVLKESWAVGYGYGTLFSIAGKIVETVGERALPDGERLPDYRDSAIPRLLLRLTSDTPVYKDLEIVRLAGIWQEAVDLLGAEHPFVKTVLDGKSPLAAATAVIEATRVDRVEERRKLIDGGAAAVNASADPLIVLARAVYPLRRRLAKYKEIDIETPIRQAADELGQLRFKLFGTDAYPDATGTLRLSYGTVRGYDADGILMPWRTNFWGLFGRRDAFGGMPPFDLPTQWLEKQRELELSTPLNFVSTLDIIGGNSGSPVVDRKGELIGLIFDGNLEGLGGRFVYTDSKARAIAVDARAIVEALVKIYGARALAAELAGH